MAPQASPLSAGGGPNTAGVRVRRGVARGMGTIQGACLGLWEENSWKKPKEAEEHKSCHPHSSWGCWAQTSPVSFGLGRSWGWWARSGRRRASVRRCWRWWLLLWRRGICKHIQKELVIAGNTRGLGKSPCRETGLTKEVSLRPVRHGCRFGLHGAHLNLHVTARVAPLTRRLRDREVSESAPLSFKARSFQESLQTFAEINYILILSLS